MVKADDKVSFEDDDGEEAKEKYSNFELLQKKVEILQEEIELMQSILKQNDLSYKDELVAETNIDDATFTKLDEDFEEEKEKEKEK